MASQNEKFTFEVTLTNPCNKEDVVGTMVSHIVITDLVDKKGGHHFEFHIFDKFVGTGLTTGSIYIGKSENNLSMYFRMTSPYPSTDGFTLNMRLISNDRHVPDFYIHANQHLTITANGITSDISNYREECR